MKKFFFIVFLLSLLLSHELYVHTDEIPYEEDPRGIEQDTSMRGEILEDFDGKKWKILSFEQKSSLYIGYELGRIMTLERIKELSELLRNVIDGIVSPEIQEEFKNLHDGLDISLELLEKYDAVVAQKEMVSMVDKFYDNPENLNIRIHHAFVISKLIKDGASAKTIKSRIDSYRKKDKITKDSFLLFSWQPTPQSLGLNPQYTLSGG